MRKNGFVLLLALICTGIHAEETWDNEPEWMFELRETLNGIISELENNLKNDL